MRIKPLALLVTGIWLAACTSDDAGDVAELPAVDNAGDVGAMTPDDQLMDTGATAMAHIVDAEGDTLGTVTLTETEQMIQVAGTLEGLPPGTHGFHLHETGVCEPPFQSAGGHWNPTDHEHGMENPQGPHLGDLPNIEVGSDSTVTVQVSSPVGATLEGTNGLLDADGAVVMVHAGADDYQSNPSGDAGDRIACGVVVAS
ncbi:MAG TPA: superoxide dismutase family protein [Longimicrobiaceae bacterium]|nr:superoxide dismutase family protein [Longimicrobiaceae bacterium]